MYKSNYSAESNNIPPVTVTLYHFACHYPITVYRNVNLFYIRFENVYK